MFQLRYSQRAADQLAEYKAKAGKSPDSSHAKVWNGISFILREVIANPERAVAPTNALRDALRGTWRDKLGRLRIFYIVSTKHQTAAVLYIGWRKEGDRRDAYAEFGRLLKKGEFDLIFAEIDVELPSVCGRPARVASG